MPQRPSKVKLAVNLLYLSLVIWVMQFFLYWPPLENAPAYSELRSSLFSLIMLAITIVDYGLYYQIGKGRNWARMIFLVLSVIGAIFGAIFLTLIYAEILVPPFVPTTPSLWTPPSITITIFQICGASLQIAALILLFQRDSSAWFRAMKIWRMPQEVVKTWPRGLEPGEALIEAARRGDMKQIAHLLATGADVNAQNKWGLTPLMAAAHGGHIEIGKLLMEKGADVNARQNGGWTALMCAAVRGQADAVSLLLGKGADISAKTENGVTALTLARSNGRSQIVEFLKAHGAEA
jgi:Ankyrin repeats (3 copies)